MRTDHVGRIVSNARLGGMARQFLCRRQIAHDLLWRNLPVAHLDFDHDLDSQVQPQPAAASSRKPAMATTSRTMSPGGALLRASRVFSLPSALSSPREDYQSAVVFKSETATQAFPTLQTVTVPEAFRRHGDWGFKRNFPLRSTTKSKTPLLRIRQIDSVEHVTDFQSASAHALTLEKFQEMNVAISLPQFSDSKRADESARKPDGSGVSVFEEKYDFTAYDEAKIDHAGNRRWKYKGPWLANLTEGEFQKYIKREVRGRRAEFREFLRKELAPDLTVQARRRAMDEGRDQEVREMRSEDVTDEHITEFLRESREHRGKLYDIISKFLDLAPLEPPRSGDTVDYLGRLRPNESAEVSTNPYASRGPPITHPSAGLSYLRTSSYLENHPFYGPQRTRRPFKARFLTIDPDDPKIGIGGFVTPSRLASMDYKNTGMDKVDYQTPGGSKLWVNVTSAEVDSNGRVIVKLEDSDGQARLIQQEMAGEKRVYHAQTDDAVGKAQEIRDSQPRSSKALRKPSVWMNGSGSAYGMQDLGRSE